MAPFTQSTNRIAGALAVLLATANACASVAHLAAVTEPLPMQDRTASVASAAAKQLPLRLGMEPLRSKRYWKMAGVRSTSGTPSLLE